jgi:hypothetical protein
MIVCAVIVIVIVIAADGFDYDYDDDYGRREEFRGSGFPGGSSPG